MTYMNKGKMLTATYSLWLFCRGQLHFYVDSSSVRMLHPFCYCTDWLTECKHVPCGKRVPGRWPPAAGRWLRMLPASARRAMPLTLALLGGCRPLVGVTVFSRGRFWMKLLSVPRTSGLRWLRSRTLPLCPSGFQESHPCSAYKLGSFLAELQFPFREDVTSVLGNEGIKRLFWLSMFFSVLSYGSAELG